MVKIITLKNKLFPPLSISFNLIEEIVYPKIMHFNNFQLMYANISEGPTKILLIHPISTHFLCLLNLLDNT